MTTNQGNLTATDILRDWVETATGDDSLATASVSRINNHAASLILPSIECEELRLWVDDTDFVIIALDAYGCEMSKARLSGRNAERTAQLIVNQAIADALEAL